MGRKSIILTFTVSAAIIAGIIGYNIFKVPVTAPPYDGKNKVKFQKEKPSQPADKYPISTAQAKDGANPVKAPPTEGPAQKSPPPDQPLDEEDISGQVMRARMLRKEPSKENIALLKEIMDSDHRVLVLSAINSLAFMGQDKELENEVFRLLEEKAKDPNFSQRGQALITAALFTKDGRVLPIINEFMDQKDSTESYIRYATAALAAIAKPICIDYLERILANAYSPEIQKSAFHTLSKIDTPQSTAILSNHLFSKNEQDQTYSAWALSLNNSPEHNGILFQALANKKLSQGAIDVLARSSAGAKVLGDLLVEDTFEISDKINTLETLKQNFLLTSNTVRADIIKSVEPLLDSGNYDLQRHALKIVGSGFGNGQVIDVISTKLSSPDSKVRETAVEAYLPYLTESNYKPLLDLIWDKNETVRRKALMSAFTYIDDSDRPLLEKAINHQDEFIRTQVSQILN